MYNNIPTQQKKTYIFNLYRILSFKNGKKLTVKKSKI